MLKKKKTIKMANIGRTFLSAERARELCRDVPRVNHVVFDFQKVSIASSSFIAELTRQARALGIQRVEFASLEQVTVREGDEVVTEFYVSPDPTQGTPP